MRILVLLFGLTLASLSGSATADDAGSVDLYRVAIRSDADARVLTEIQADVLMAAGDGYLILAGPDERDLLAASGLEYELIATDVDRQHLAVDFRPDPSMPLRFPVVFEGYGKRLLQVEPGDLQDKSLKNQILPIRTRIPRVEYREPARLKSALDIDYLALDSLIGRVNQDSIRSYVEQLQAFPVRLMGTSGMYSVAYWLVNKFRAFGYDSVGIDPFVATNNEGDEVSCRNVVAYKPGTEYPYHQIIVGGHFDAVEGSPGADDNGTGTASVLEIARVLADVDTKLTFVFIPFDGEEGGLLGSAHYAEQAAVAGDNIVLMLNMDMIGHYENDTTVNVYYGDNETLGRLWADLADSIPSIDLHGVLMGSFMSSDDQSFYNYGYDMLALHEYIFSTKFHQPTDSAVYLNYDYTTRIVKANVATLAVTDAALSLPPSLVLMYQSTPSEIIIPGRSNPLRVEVVEYAGGQLVPGSVLLHYCLGGEWSAAPMAAAGGDIYEIELPAPECGNKLSYYVSAEEVGGGMYYIPDPTRPLTAVGATVSSIVFEDNFSTDKGWTVTGDTISSAWRRVETYGSPYGDDYDGSGYCYTVTVNRTQSILTSPPIELVAPEARIRFAFWYDNCFHQCTDQDDVFIIGVYNDEEFETLETVGPVEGTGREWQTRDYNLSDFCVPGDQIRLCLIVSDTGAMSVDEAGVDAVSVVCYSYAPNILTETLPDAAVGVPYARQLEADGCSEPLVWTDEYTDLAGTGLSLSTDGIISGTAVDTGHFWIDAVVEDTAGRTAERWYRLRVKLDYRCGDANGDKMVNVADAVFVINYVFKGGAAPVPKDAADANHDNLVNVADAVYLINYVFRGGPPPVPGC